MSEAFGMSRWVNDEDVSEARIDHVSSLHESIKDISVKEWLM